MDIPIDSWYRAIFLRHSQRKYSGEVPDENLTKKIEKVCSEFKPFNGARAVLVRETANDVFKGAIGPYFFKVTNAPYYIAFLADVRIPKYKTVTGYVGEGIILEATSLGLNTCWVGGFFRREAVKKQVNLLNHERVLAITPIGYSEDERDRAGVSKKQHRRKDLKNLVIGGEIGSKGWVKSAVEAARVAPSAANRQPWRFQIGDDSISVSSDSKREGFNVSRKLDCGIAMLHLELGARSTGVQGSWEFLRFPNVAKYNIS
jgi:hypothetical protein